MKHLDLVSPVILRVKMPGARCKLVRSLFKRVSIATTHLNEAPKLFCITIYHISVDSGNMNVEWKELAINLLLDSLKLEWIMVFEQFKLLL